MVIDGFGVSVYRMAISLFLFEMLVLRTNLISGGKKGFEKKNVKKNVRS